MKISTTIVLALLLCVGCGDHEKAKLSEKIGSNCTVQFRRGDALGGGGNLPVSPTVGNINGADTSLTGKLKSCDKEWIVLEQGQPKAELWIPRESVLLLEF